MLAYSWWLTDPGYLEKTFVELLDWGMTFRKRNWPQTLQVQRQVIGWSCEQLASPDLVYWLVCLLVLRFVIRQCDLEAICEELTPMEVC